MCVCVCHQCRDVEYVIIILDGSVIPAGYMLALADTGLDAPLVEKQEPSKNSDDTQGAP